MFEGRLEAIFLAEKKGQNPRSVDRAEAVAGKGLLGDRYYRSAEPGSGSGNADREITLIEAEALEALAREDNLVLQPWQARRNLLTRGVPLNHLVGRKFTVGSVVLRGIRLCEPCGYLEKLTRPGVQKGLCHRGGLRAQIVQGGELQPGDVIRPAGD